MITLDKNLVNKTYTLTLTRDEINILLDALDWAIDDVKNFGENLAETEEEKEENACTRQDMEVIKISTGDFMIWLPRFIRPRQCDICHDIEPAPSADVACPECGRLVWKDEPLPIVMKIVSNTIEGFKPEHLDELNAIVEGMLLALNRRIGTEYAIVLSEEEES